MFCFVLLCFHILGAQMIYFLDHKDHISQEILFLLKEESCNYLRALKSLKLQGHVDSRNLSHVCV